jgi:hypothetical protein
MKNASRLQPAAGTVSKLGVTEHAKLRTAVTAGVRPILTQDGDPTKGRGHP